MTGITIRSENISSPDFSDSIGKNSYLNYSFQTSQYSPVCSIKTIISNEIPVQELENDSTLVQEADFADYISGVAYSVRCVRDNVTIDGPALVTMAVSHDWVLDNSPYIMPHDRFIVGGEDANGSFIQYCTQFNYSDPANNLDYYTVTSPTAFNLSGLYIKQYNASLSIADSGMKIIDPADPSVYYTNSAVIAVDSDWVLWNSPGIWSSLYEPVTVLHTDDDGNGEVLNATHLYYDPDSNLDIFTADSPHGLSEFTLATAGKYGNPLQLLYLSVLSRVSPPAVPTSKPASHPNNYAGGGGGGGGSYSGDASLVTSPPSSSGSTSPSALSAPGTNSEGALSSSGLNSPEEPGNTAKAPYVAPPNQVTTLGATVPKNQPGVNVGGVFVQIPNSSVFTLFIEAAAMISVVLIVVFSTFIRYRRKEKE